MCVKKEPSSVQLYFAQLTDEYPVQNRPCLLLLPSSNVEAILAQGGEVLVAHFLRMAQRGLVSPVVTDVDGPTTTIGPVATNTATSATKGFWQRSRPQPAAPPSSDSGSQHTFQSCGIRGHSSGEVVQVGGGIVGIGCSKRLDECQQYMVRAVAEQERLQEENNVGSARLEELKREASAIPPPMEVDNTSDRIQQLEAMVAKLRKQRDDLLSNSAASKRVGETPLDPSELVPETLEELPQWITSTTARMSMAMEREDLALVAELSAQLVTGGMKLASGKRRCGSALAVVK